MAKFFMKEVQNNKTLGQKTIRLMPQQGKTVNFDDIKKFYCFALLWH